MGDPRSDLAALLRPVRGTTRAAVVVQVVGSLAELVPYVAIGELARALLDGDPSTATLRTLTLLLLGGLALRALCGSSAIMLTHFADVRLQALLRRRIVARLGRVPLGWFGSHSSGTVRKATENDIAALHYLVAHQAVETTAGVTVPAAALAYLAWLDWRLALIALLPVALYAGLFTWMMRDGGPKMAQTGQRLAAVNSAIVEMVRGTTVVKTFGRTGRAHRTYRDAATSYADFFEGWARPMLRLEVLSSVALTAPFTLLVNLGLGTWLWSRGWVDGIDVLVASMVALVLPSSIQTLSHGITPRAEAAAAATRISALLETPELPLAPHPEPPTGALVELEDARFAYVDGTLALDGVSLRLEPGTVTALVGPSGSGKSTLAALVLRFHDLNSGTVRVGGVDVRRIEPLELYRRVGFVLQDIRLLATTVADNIALGDPTASRARVEEVARAARIHERIVAAPGGYDAVVGRDVTFSGGEAQRISIARALLHDPEVLVLDEATAYADPDVELEVQAALSELAAGRTLLVVAHRLDTIRDADTIVVLDRGRVVEHGSHEQLLARGGRYSRLWQTTRTSSTFTSPAAQEASR